ncbi:MAG TPA: ABC transporter substrate-binding protein [Polyangiaceae bacterium]
MSALLMPMSAIGQRARVARVAFLVQSPQPWLVAPLLAGLQQRGWVEGKNLVLDVHSSERDAQRVDGLILKFVEQDTDVIVVVGTHFARAAQRVTKTIPIVMYLSGFPVEGGLVQSFARPGGNITGLATYSGEAFFTKHVSLMRELVPSLREFGVLWDYLPPVFLEKEAEFGLRALQLAATELKVNARVRTIATQDDLAKALADFEQRRVQAVFSTSGPMNGGQSPGTTRIIEFSLRRRLPLVCDIAGSLFRAGGLLSYSASWAEAADRCASFVDRILRGAKAAELPIERPTKFELVLNLKTAKAIGITIPPAMLVRADSVIE